MPASPNTYWQTGGPPPRVVIESPFAASNGRSRSLHIRYARQAIRHSLLRGEAPFASHLIYTQPGVLDDNDQDERDMGIERGLIWGDSADYVVAYLDHGVSRGMAFGLQRALRRRGGHPAYARLILGNDGEPRHTAPPYPLEFEIHGIAVAPDGVALTMKEIDPDHLGGEPYTIAYKFGEPIKCLRTRAAYSPYSLL